MQTAWTQIRTDKMLSLSGSKLFDPLMVFLKEFFEKANFDIVQQATKKHAKIPSIQIVNSVGDFHYQQREKLGFQISAIKPFSIWKFSEALNACI